LEDKNWNIYILDSSQDSEEDGYFFLYNKRQELHTGQCPDFKTGEIELVPEKPNISVLNGKGLNDIKLPETYQWEYKSHWIIESSW
jgi:hypothetical protein